MKTLRPYQAAAETSLFKYLFSTTAVQPLVVAPVAAGKSLMIAEFIKKLHDYFPRCRIVMLTHVKELLEQNAKELLSQYKDVDMGFYCAGLGQKRLNNDVTFASIQSIHNKLPLFNRVPEIIIIDEAHLISHKAATQYRKFIDAALELNPNCRVVGYTGTPFRADTGRLDEGEGKLFDGVAYEIGMDFMLDEGYWARPVAPEIAAKIDVTGVKMSKGDYQEKALQEAVNKDEVTDPCIAEMVEKAKGRNRWLVFTAGVEHAEEVTAKLNAAGVSARYVHSKQANSINNQNLKDHKAGLFTALINVAKLTTGYNDPYIDMMAFLRPTRSPVLYIQMTGRGVRPVYAEGYDISTRQGRLDAIANSVKPDCMILDFGDVVGTLGPIDQVAIRKKYTGEKEGDDEVGEAITKICPSCGTECAAGQKYCYACSYCFIELSEQAGSKAIVSSDVEPEWVGVLSTTNSYHRTPDSWQPSMKVTYATMLGAIREWVCFQHWKADEGDNRRYAWTKAKEWHDRRLDCEPPRSIEDALDLKYPNPTEILVRKKGKYYEVLDYKFKPPEETLPPEEEDYEIPF